ncbi:ABC transporter permease [Phreatobacter stygius]|uniref:ABC transporter permease n=1 Tax=Phreatobacter stygius TaxID=1940610 RepID=A0A4D7B5E3_9HYPH|nr:ABC transporter permease [Phreatobacter stygius]QCI65320.1 ABC transporter permease [Phreatobacter stygius]
MADLALPTGLSRRLHVRSPGIWVILALLILVFAVTAPGFLSQRNITNIGQQSSILLILALPMTLIILTEGLDLSMGALTGLVSMGIALTSSLGYPVPVAILVGLSIGFAGGLFNGVLVAKLQIPPFVGTLGTLGMAQGLAVVMTDGQSIVDIADAIPDFYSARVLGMPAPVLVAVIAYAVTHFLLYRTQFGVAVFALGGNREAWKLAGGHVDRCLIAVYGFAGLMVGIAGFLFTARMSAGHPTASLGMEFDALAAVALGGTSFERGNGWLFGTVLGVLAIGVLRNGLNLLGFASSMQVVSVGLLVLVALFIDGFRRGS